MAVITERRLNKMHFYHLISKVYKSNNSKHKKIILSEFLAATQTINAN